MTRRTSAGPRRAATPAPIARRAILAAAAASALAAGPGILLADEPGQAPSSPAGLAAVGVHGQAAAPWPGPDKRTDPGDVAIVDLQRQVNELRGDLLDEREQRIGRLQEINGAVLVVLGVLIGIGGLWAYAKFRHIAREARIGAAAVRAGAASPQDLLPRAGAAPGMSGEELQPVPRLVRATFQAAAGTESGHAVATGRLPGPAPAREVVPGPGREVDEADLERLEEVVADCTGAIRRSPDDPRLFVERGAARSGLCRYEEAIADFDRALALDPDSVAAWLGRGQANSELGRHDDAIDDYERVESLDPDTAGAPGEL